MLAKFYKLCHSFKIELTPTISNWVIFSRIVLIFISNNGNEIELHITDSLESSKLVTIEID